MTMANPEPAAVVGASGFIGSHLAAALTGAGVPVSCFTRAVPFTLNGGRRGQRTPFQVVFYLATSIGPANAEHCADLVAADHRRFCQALDELERLDRPPLVVLGSSGGTVYDTGRPPYSEQSPTCSAFAYGSAKLALEAELAGRELPGAVLRLANVYGPGQRTGTGLGVVAHWLAAAAGGQPLVLFGDPRARRDYVYVDDVVAAMTGVYDRVCRNPVARSQGLPTLNIGSGIPTSLAQLLGLIESVTGRRLEVHRVAAREVDRQDTWLDTTAAARLLGWQARTPLAHGLARTWCSIAREGRRPLRA
jgi:UDP-glucose 4-epimerase